MRKVKLWLLTLLMAVGGVESVKAQTDVTDSYITNAGFEGEYKRFLDINNDRGVEKPNGWSVEWTQTATDQNGMTYVGSMTQDKQTWSAYEGEKAYFTRMRWKNATLNLRQTMSYLRPGSYTLSFYATASKLNGGDGSASVSVAGQTQSITVGTSETTDWKQYNINFTITESTPYATIEVTASRTKENFKFGIDNFTLTYDGSSYYAAILDKAQSLYDNNKDWAEGADALNTAISSATGKSTVNEKNAAIVALEDAMSTFKEANTVDVTNRITNANFDSDISGWTLTGGDGNAYQRNTSAQNNFNGGFLEKWRNGWNGGYNQKNFDVSQTISGLPNGEYTVKAAIIAVMEGSKEAFSSNTTYTNKKHGGPYYIDDEKGVWLYGTSGENSGKAWANTKNTAFDGDGAEYKTATIKVENGSLTIGFKGIGSTDGGTALGTYANWIACDNWTLSYFGFDPSTLKSAISDLKNEIQTLIDGDEIPTAVKNSLNNTIENLVETPETKSVLEAAITTLENAIAAANATKSAYAKAKAHIIFVSTEVENSIGTKDDIEAAISTATANIETRTTAEELTADYNTLEAARQTYVLAAEPTEGHSFDYTFKIKNAQVTSTDNWANASISTNQQYTGAPDNTYLDKYNGNANITQMIGALREGRFTLQVATRAHADVTVGNIYVRQNSANLNQTNINHVGNTGGELGNGWSWTEVPFENFSDADVTIGFYAECGSNKWAGADDFRLYYNGNYVSTAEATEILASIVDGKMGNDAATAQNEAKTAFQNSKTIANYNALRTAIDAAQASKDAYAAGKQAIDKADDILSKTNVYTPEAYTTFAEALEAARTNYNNGTWTGTEGALYKNGMLGTGWHTSATVSTLLSSAWDNAKGNWNDYHVNTWSTIDDSGNPNLVVPTFEYWVGETSKLADKVMTATITVEPYETYTVAAHITAARNTTDYNAEGADQTLAPVGVTLQVGEGTPTTCTGTRVAETRFFEGTFEATGEADGEGKLTIKIAANETDANWILFRDVKYTKQPAAEATAEEIAALSTAISEAETHTLGFDKDEYAPYNNTDALTKLAVAKKALANSTTKPAINGSKDALLAASWSANAEDVDAVYNGSFAEVTPGANYPNGWTRTNSWGQMQSGLAGDYATAYYNQPGTLKYGDTGIYTMPLNANTVYELTVVFRSHATNSNNAMNVSVLNEGSEGLARVNLGYNKSQDNWKTVKKLFRTGAAGNYVLKLENDGNTWMTGVSLVKAEAENITIAEGETYTPAEKYANVTFNRALVQGWNGLVLPFDMTVTGIKDKFSATKVKNFTGIKYVEAEGVTLQFADFDSETTVIPAGTPFLVKVKADAAGSSYTINGVVLPATGLKNITVTAENKSNIKYTMKGTHAASTDLTKVSFALIQGNTFFYHDGAAAKASSAKAFRAYFENESEEPAAARVSFDFGDDVVTGITELAQPKTAADGTYYDLQGRKVETFKQKGIYIVNGRKVVK